MGFPVVVCFDFVDRREGRGLGRCCLFLCHRWRGWGEGAQATMQAEQNTVVKGNKKEER